MSKVTINVTLHGVSADLECEAGAPLGEHDVKRIALEAIRSGGVPGMHIANLPEDAFAGYVVDRVAAVTGGERLYLRPKVPFGGR